MARLKSKWRKYHQGGTDVSWVGPPPIWEPRVLTATDIGNVAMDSRDDDAMWERRESRDMSMPEHTLRVALPNSVRPREAGELTLPRGDKTSYAYLTPADRRRPRKRSRGVTP